MPSRGRSRGRGAAGAAPGPGATIDTRRGGGPVTGGGATLGLTLAINDYDHVRDLTSGSIPVEGVSLTCLTLPVEEIFYRFSRYREWDVSELSLGKFCWLRAQGEDVVGIPVFPSRSFRHSAIFVRRDGPVSAPARLAGGRIGIPEWTQTATVWVRGLLHHTFGVRLDGVHWFQGGVNQPGRVEGVPVTMPPGITCTPVADRTLNDMVVAGDLDAVISAHPPTDIKRRTGRIVRLFPDYRAVEERYFRETGIFPIMHVIAIRGEVYRRHPWVAMNLYTAFELAKRRSLERLADVNAPRLPIAWNPAHVAAVQETFGGDPWPYGIKANRVTLEAFLAFTEEQGIVERRLSPEDLFVPEVQTSFRI